MQFGTFYQIDRVRLMEMNTVMDGRTNEDRTLAIVGYYRVLNGVNCNRIVVSVLQGLNPDMLYENSLESIQKIHGR